MLHIAGPWTNNLYKLYNHMLYLLHQNIGFSKGWTIRKVTLEGHWSKAPNKLQISIEKDMYCIFKALAPGFMYW